MDTKPWPSVDMVWPIVDMACPSDRAGRFWDRSPVPVCEVTAFSLNSWLLRQGTGTGANDRIPSEHSHSRRRLGQVYCGVRVLPVWVTRKGSQFQGSWAGGIPPGEREGVGTLPRRPGPTGWPGQHPGERRKLEGASATRWSPWTFLEEVAVWGGERLAVPRGNWPGLLGAWCGRGPEKESPRPKAACAPVPWPTLQTD